MWHIRTRRHVSERIIGVYYTLLQYVIYKCDDKPTLDIPNNIIYRFTARRFLTCNQTIALLLFCSFIYFIFFFISATEVTQAMRYIRRELLMLVLVQITSHGQRTMYYNNYYNDNYTPFYYINTIIIILTTIIIVANGFERNVLYKSMTREPAILVFPYTTTNTCVLLNTHTHIIIILL